MAYIVYQITCAVNGKTYIGCTGRTLKKRFNEHVDDSKHRERFPLGDDIKVHGRSAFIIERLWSGDVLEDAYEAEVGFIAERNSQVPNGYNLAEGGPGRRGTYVKTGPRADPMPQETRDKIRAAKLGKPMSDQTKEKLRAANLGKKQSPETIEKMRTASTGRMHSPETKAKMSTVQRGRTFTEESRAKMSLAQRGRPRNPESTRRQLETWERKKQAKQSAQLIQEGC